MALAASSRAMNLQTFLDTTLSGESCAMIADPSLPSEVAGRESMGSDTELRSETPQSATTLGMTTQPAYRERADWFKRVTDVLTIIILAFGLYFAWDQAKKLTESINANNNSINLSSVATLGNQSLMVDKTFVDNPDFIKYFFENAQITEESPNYDKAAALATLLLDYFDTARAVAQYTSQFLPIL